MLFHLQILPYYWFSERGRIIAQCTEENTIHRRFVINLNVFVVFFYKPTILDKTFGTLCVSGKENVIEVDPLPSWTVLSVTSQTPFIYFVHVKGLNFVPGGGGILLRACLWVCIEIRYKNTWKRGSVQKPFSQDCSNCGQVLTVTVNSTYDQWSGNC